MGISFYYLVSLQMTVTDCYSRTNLVFRLSRYTFQCCCVKKLGLRCFLLSNGMCFNPKDMKLHYGDLTDSTCLVKIINEVKPTEIYNLGAQSHVKVSRFPYRGSSGCVPEFCILPLSIASSHSTAATNPGPRVWFLVFVWVLMSPCRNTNTFF